MDNAQENLAWLMTIATAEDGYEVVEECAVKIHGIRVQYDRYIVY